MKFKVGDTVRLIDASHEWGTVNKGDIGVIASIPKGGTLDYYRVNFPDHLSGWMGLERCFELVEPIPVVKETRFVVGDEVRVVAETSGWGQVNEGDVGVVKTIEVTPWKETSYKVDFAKQSGWRGTESCFVPASKSKVAAPPLGKGGPKFKIGDTVRLVTSCSGIGPAGTIFVISSFRPAHTPADRFLYFVWGRLGVALERDLTLHKPWGKDKIRASEEEQKDRRIRIKVRRTGTGDLEKVTVVSISALSRSLLPSRYLKDKEHMVFFCVACQALGCHLPRPTLAVERTYTAAEFADKIKFVRECGDRLTQINKDRKKEDAQAKLIAKPREEEITI